MLKVKQIDAENPRILIPTIGLNSIDNRDDFSNFPIECMAKNPIGFHRLVGYSPGMFLIKILNFIESFARQMFYLLLSA